MASNTSPADIMPFTEAQINVLRVLLYCTSIAGMLGALFVFVSNILQLLEEIFFSCSDIRFQKLTIFL